MRQVENKCKIEGILSEVELKYGSFVKDGKTVENINGQFKVLVKQEINGEVVALNIPVHVYANKLKKNSNDINPSYESLEKVMTEYASIAKTGSEATADKIRITNGYISMNEYYGKNGNLVSFPRVHTNFVSRVVGEFKPEASFSLEFAISDIKPVVDKDGVEVDPAVLEVTAIVPVYDGSADVIKMVAKNPNVISAINTYWEKDKTFKANGRINFTSTTETVVEEVGFGEGTTKTRTINLNELVIIGGTQEPYEGDFELSVEELAKGLAIRKDRLEKSKAKAGNAPKKTPAPTSSLSSTMDDMGF